MVASAKARRSSLVILYVLLAALVSLLTACPRPLLAPTGSGGAPGMALDPEAAVSGHVDFGARKTQATIKDDVAPGATVSLIEVTSGQTLATTFTQPDGRFVLQFSNGFKPVSGGLYYFEAVKGLSGPTGQPNAVGADAVRVRTIASYRRGGWVTLSAKGVTTSIAISPMTTALSVVVSLRTGTAFTMAESRRRRSARGRTASAIPARKEFLIRYMSASGAGTGSTVTCASGAATRWRR